MSSPPPKSLVPAPTVWPPSNPSGTVIPFPLPWGQTGCCPPGGMDALMKCYCDLQQASAFIGQVMLDQFANNPAQIAAIISGIEASGSNLPLIGVTNGQPAQPGQVGEFVVFNQTLAAGAGTVTQSVTMGVLQPGDWDVWAHMIYDALDTGQFVLNPVPAGFSGDMNSFLYSATSTNASVTSSTYQALISVPSLVNFSVTTTNPGTANTPVLQFTARRAR